MNVSNKASLVRKEGRGGGGVGWGKSNRGDFQPALIFEQTPWKKTSCRLFQKFLQGTIWCGQLVFFAFTLTLP